MALASVRKNIQSTIKKNKFTNKIQSTNTIKVNIESSINDSKIIPKAIDFKNEINDHKNSTSFIKPSNSITSTKNEFTTLNNDLSIDINDNNKNKSMDNISINNKNNIDIVNKK